MKKITLGVTDFALPVPRIGSIDIHAGFGSPAMNGTEIHQHIQQQKMREFKTYQPEVLITEEFAADGYIFKITGRMDGVYHDEPFKIEEIKSSFNIFSLARYIKTLGEHHPYVLQLKTYGYFHWLKTKEIPTLILLLASTRNYETHELTVKLNIAAYEDWLKKRLVELVKEAKYADKTLKRRGKAAANIQFPFANLRAGQADLMNAVEEAMKNKQQLMLQAPTGIGKTIGVLYPTLKEALTRGHKVIYVTPKNSQHMVAEEAIKQLQTVKTPIKSFTLTAKSKLCLKGEPICNSEYCEFAENHYSKIAEHELQQQLLKKKNLTAKTFKEFGEAYQVCPFELQFEAIKYYDAIICDYNYVFAPRNTTNRITTNHLRETGKPNLIIDEVHNLPARSMDYYSPALSSVVFENMVNEADKIAEDFRARAIALLHECLAIIKKLAPDNCRSACKITPPINAFIKHDTKCREFLSTYLNSDVEIEAEDLIMRFTYYWSQFTDALEFVNVNKDEFFITFHPNPATIKITCCDASEMLKPAYIDYHHVIGFSATLKPFDYYSQLTGLKSDKLKTLEFASTFPTKNRKILIIPQISTKYSERERNYPRIAESIERITNLKLGNYVAFFPSFEFLEKTLDVFTPPFPFKVIKQKRGMHKDEINKVFDYLMEDKGCHIVFAVQGGVFSEGIDYKGKMAIGAFVIGPPLPNYDLEREKMKEYYQKHYAAGFDYAYVYPAMTKAIQAAGRVIRSETDKGIIVLMDNRFIQASYTKCMPNDWFQENCQELVSTKILQELTDFWLTT